MSRAIRVCSVLFVALAAWLSQGTIAYTGTGAERVALLPWSEPALALVALATAGALVASRRALSVAPFFLLAPLLLQWVPWPLPPVFHMWGGPMGALLWIAAVLATAAGAARPASIVRRPRLLAGLVAGAVFSVSAWQVAPSLPEGDEPHYLVITQSLLKDGDLKIENNHRDGDYLAYFAGTLRPDYLRPGRDGEIYSIHAPGVSALVAPAFALGGYYAVVGFLILCASAGSVLAWHVSWLVTRHEGAAWFGWAAVTFSTTAIFHSFAVYPDLPGAVLTLTGVWALIRARQEAESGATRAWPWLLHGIALAMLPWMHTRFALLAGNLGVLILLRLAATPRAMAKAVAFLSVPAGSALAWIGYFVAIYGTPDPSAPYGVRPDSGAFEFIPGGLAGLLFDQRFGLLAYAPVLFFAAGGLVVMLRQPAYRRIALEILFVVVPYLVVVTRFAMWWAGHSAPSRFFLAVLPLMSIPAAVAWTSIRSRTTRATAWGALAFTVFASCVLVVVDGGRLAYNTREGYAAWLAWLNPALDLGRGMPAFWRGREHELFRDAAIWIAAMAVAWALLRALERSPRLRGRSVFAALTAAAYAAAAGAALVTVWTISDTQPSRTTSAQLQLLRRLGSEPRVLTFEPANFYRIAPASVPARLRIAPQRANALGGAGRDDRPLFILPAIPAGTYRLQPTGGGEGSLMVGIGRDRFALRTEEVGSPPQPIVLDFPIAVRGIIVRGDEQARRAVTHLTVEALSILPPGARLSDRTATRAVRYGAASAYFLDDRSFPEPESFWVGGARTSEVVVQPDRPRPAIPVILRNGPVANRITIESGKWKDEFSFAPGEERRISIPADERRGAALIRFTASSGFRPSAVERGSRDDRFLGIWVKLAIPNP